MGLRVGDAVDGRRVGDRVGADDGATVGDDDGVPVGERIGRRVGD